MFFSFWSSLEIGRRLGVFRMKRYRAVANRMIERFENWSRGGLLGYQVRIVYV